MEWENRDSQTETHGRFQAYDANILRHLRYCADFEQCDINLQLMIVMSRLPDANGGAIMQARAISEDRESRTYHRVPVIRCQCIGY